MEAGMPESFNVGQGNRFEYQYRAGKRFGAAQRVRSAGPAAGCGGVIPSVGEMMKELLKPVQDL